jgi:hypothetical protein
VRLSNVSVLTSDAIERTRIGPGTCERQIKRGGARPGRSSKRKTFVSPRSGYQPPLPLRDCVAIRDVEVRAKVSPFAKGGFFDDVKPR